VVGRQPGLSRPVFILTHHIRPTIEMDGGTTFDFIDRSPAKALERVGKGYRRACVTGGSRELIFDGWPWVVGIRRI
jgi:dihydrofolate reductase